MGGWGGVGVEWGVGWDGWVVLKYTTVRHFFRKSISDPYMY